MAFNINKMADAVMKTRDFQDLEDAGVSVSTPGNKDPKDPNACEDKAVHVPYAWLMKKYICKQLTMRMDMQKMSIENISDENLKLLEVQFNHNKYELIKDLVGEIRVCEGMSAISIQPYKFQNQARIFFEAAHIDSDPEYLFGNLVSVTTRSISKFKHTNGVGHLHSVWTLKGDKVHIKTEGRDAKTRELVKKEDWAVQFTEERILNIDFIPVTVFFNNPRGESEFCGFEEIFKRIEDVFNSVAQEIKLGATHLVLNDLILNDDAQNVVSSIKDGERYIITSYPDTAFGTPITSVSTNGKIQEIQAQFTEDKNEIISLMCMPSDFSSEGKNNKHNLEVAQSDAVARTNLEAKRNNVHETYKEFIWKLIMMNMTYGVIPFTEDESNNFELVWEDAQAEAEMQEQNNMAKDQNKKEEE